LETAVCAAETAPERRSRCHQAYTNEHTSVAATTNPSAGRIDDHRNRPPLRLRRHIVLVEAQQPGVLTYEATHENRARELAERFPLDGVQEALRDLQFVGDLLQLKVALDAFAAQGLANGGHT
jgi:hypothetical protein